jgi:hypothetical protein
MRGVPERQDRPWPSVSVSLRCGRLAAGRITGRLTTTPGSVPLPTTLPPPRRRGAATPADPVRGPAGSITGLAAGRIDTGQEHVLHPPARVGQQTSPVVGPRELPSIT